MQKQYVQTCHEKLKKEMQNREAFEGLSRGYRIKTKLFRNLPGFYLAVYHLKKYIPS
jgi:hypothetical protein